MTIFLFLFIVFSFYEQGHDTIIVPCPRRPFNCFSPDFSLLTGFLPHPFLKPFTGLPLNKLLKGLLHGLAACKLTGDDEPDAPALPFRFRRLCRIAALLCFCHRHLPPIIIFVFLLLTRFFSHFHFFIEIFSKSMSFPLAMNHGYSDV